MPVYQLSCKSCIRRLRTCTGSVRPKRAYSFAKQQSGQLASSGRLRDHPCAGCVLPKRSICPEPGDWRLYANCVQQVACAERQAIVPHNYTEPSNDLRELCNTQLDAIYKFLSRLGNDVTDVRSAVYARFPSDHEQGTLQLRKVAAVWPGNPADARGLEDGWDDMVVLRLGDCAGGQVSCEDVFLREEMVVLPNSAALVLPLVEVGCLVGLLVIERAPQPAAPQSSSMLQGREVPFSADELWCFRVVAPALAKACAIDQRSVAAAAHTGAAAAVARTLVRDARGPLAALQTFGGMLLPRLQEGQADKDLARNILTQGRRLQEVVQQLEQALKPEAYMPPNPLPELTWHAGGSLQPGSMLGGAPEALGMFPLADDVLETKLLGQARERLQLPCPLPSDSAAGGSVSMLPLPYPIEAARQLAAPDMRLPAALQAAAQAVVAAAVQRGGTGGSASTPDVTPGVVQNRPQDNLQVQALTPQTAGVDIAGSSNDAVVGAPRAQLLPFAPDASADMTISMSVDDASDKELAVARPSSGAAAGPSGRVRPRPGGECNVVEVLVNVLTAAHRLARATGIHLSVQHPLRVVSKHAQHSGSRGGTPVPALLPPPVRPLRAGIRASVLVPLMAYVVDIVLQCTPRSGQVVVSAHTNEPGGGVVLEVVHTGRIIADRLLACTRALYPQQQHSGAGKALAPAAEETTFVSLEFAQKLVQEVGGWIRISYPVKLLNGATQVLEVGTCIEMWLPGVAHAPDGKTDSPKTALAAGQRVMVAA